MTRTPTRPIDPPADWLTFHLTHPSQGGQEEPFDPNAIFFWAGRYHFHYVYPSEDGLAYAHVSSPDLVRWTWHPTVLTATATGHEILSGSGFLTKEGRPAIIYASRDGDGLGMAQIVYALDDALDSWSAPISIEPHVRSDMDLTSIVPWDPHGWFEDGTYYALFGAHASESDGILQRTIKQVTLLKSADLQSWDYVGPLLGTDLPDAEDDTDISCPELFPLGREHMLLCISHNLGCRYYLGEWKDEKFTPTRHGRMNWQPTPHVTEWAGAESAPSQNDGRAVFFAPESLLAPDGRRIMWAWCWIAGLQNGIQSIPRELSLPEDGVLRIAPLRELATLRRDEVEVTGIEVPPAGISLVDGVAGDALECTITIRFGSARRVGVAVLCDADGSGGLPITVDRDAETLTVGGTAAPFAPEPESVTLRVFIDKAMVEVFADDRQAVIGARSHSPRSVHVGLFADDRVTADLTAWRLDSIYADDPAITPDEAGDEVVGLSTGGPARS